MKRWAIIVLIVMLLLCGCGQRVYVSEAYLWEVCYAGEIGGKLYAGALNSDKMAISSVQHLPIYKIESVQELENFIANYGSEFTMDQSYNEIPSFNEVMAEKDEAFFEDNTLFLIAVPTNSGSYRFSLNYIDSDDGKYCVHVSGNDSLETMTTDMAGWFMTVTEEKCLAECFTEFDAQLNNP